jgi:hypothetical protein
MIGLRQGEKVKEGKEKYKQNTSHVRENNGLNFVQQLSMGSNCLEQGWAN